MSDLICVVCGTTDCGHSIADKRIFLIDHNNNSEVVIAALKVELAQVKNSYEEVLEQLRRRSYCHICGKRIPSMAGSMTVVQDDECTCRELQAVVAKLSTDLSAARAWVKKKESEESQVGKDLRATISKLRDAYKERDEALMRVQEERHSCDVAIGLELENLIELITGSRQTHLVHAERCIQEMHLELEALRQRGSK